MIIVEGCDNTGKTRLIEQLVRIFPTLIPIKSKGLERPDLSRWLCAQLLEGADFLKRRIYDRFFLSELVYGPVLRGGTSFTDDEESFIWGLLTVEQPLIIICHRDDLAAAVATLGEREQLDGIDQHYTTLSGRYHTLIGPLLEENNLSPLWYDFAEEGSFESILTPRVAEYLRRGY